MVGSDGGIVCTRPDAFRIDVSSRAEPSSCSLREEIENGERHRGLIDPAICEGERRGGERAQEKEEGNRGPIKYLGD